MNRIAEPQFDNYAPNPWDYVAEEMKVRGWSKDELANRMGHNTVEEWQIDRLTLDFMETIRAPNVRLGETTIQKLSFAFGVSADLFRNLQDAWLERPDLEAICDRLTAEMTEPTDLGGTVS